MQTATSKESAPTPPLTPLPPATVLETHVALDVDKIDPSPTNPRKTFNDAKLRELGESLRLGQEADIKVRPHPTKKGRHMLVYGERRWRAAKLVGLETLHATIVDMTELQVMRSQLIENGHREDVHPIEEAELYLALVRDHGYTTDMLVAEFHKSASHLRGRIKIATSLCKRAKEACLAGELGTMHAEIIARLDPKVQDLATREALGEELTETQAIDVPANVNDGVASEEVQLDPGNWQSKRVRAPLSFRALQQLLHRRYMLRLDAAKFDTTDDELVKGVGACGPCEFRSGNQKDLFPDLAKPADVCTKPSCFQLKTEAAASAALTLAEEEGREVLADAGELKKVFRPTGAIAHDSPYVAPDDKIPWDLDSKAYRDGATWKKLLGKRADECTVVAPAPDGGVLELLNKTDAIAILREEGALKKKTSPAEAAKKKAAKGPSPAQVKKNLKLEAFKRCLGLLAEAAEKVDVSGGKKLVPILRLCVVAVAEAGISSYEHVAARRDPTSKRDEMEILEKAIDKANAAGLVGILVELLAANAEAVIVDGESWRHRTETKATFDGLCELLGVDFEKQHELAKAAAIAEEKVAAAKGKK